MTVTRTSTPWFLVALAVGLASGASGGQSLGSIERLSPEIDELIPEDAAIEKVAGGFTFIEGPVWVGGHSEDAHLLFSDIPSDRVHRLDPHTGAVAIEIEPVLLPQLEAGGVGGSNGLLLDARGRLVLFEHGNRRVARREENGSRVTLVDRYQGRRLNSPNDGVYHSGGALFFTDPPYGLSGQDEDPAKELAFNGVYRLDPNSGSGEASLHLLTQLKRPNGIGLSPDEKRLYVASSDLAERLWMAYPVRGDLTLGNGEIFFDGRELEAAGVPDGLVVDSGGNLWATGPGGVLVISPEGEHLGTVGLPELPANVTFDPGERDLYVTARTGLYRLRLRSPEKRGQ